MRMSKRAFSVNKLSITSDCSLFHVPYNCSCSMLLRTTSLRTDSVQSWVSRAIYFVQHWSLCGAISVELRHSSGTSAFSEPGSVDQNRFTPHSPRTSMFASTTDQSLKFWYLIGFNYLFDWVWIHTQIHTQIYGAITVGAGRRCRKCSCRMKSPDLSHICALQSLAERWEKKCWCRWGRRGVEVGEV